jgi:phosphate transport system substrate-binding protein
VNENKPAKKIFNEKPKRRTFSLTVTYQKGSVYGLKFDGKTLGEVSVDPKTVAVPDSAVAIELPDAPITVIKRKDFFDTTLHFTNYLNKAQPTIWSRSANDAFDSAFPGTVPTSFVSAQGNDGVLNEVIARAGSIGYAELAYINERVFSGSQIGIAKIRNGAGEFVAVSSAGTKLSLSAAAVDETSGVVTPNYDNTVSGAYPITMVTYGLANTSGFGTTADNAIAKTYVNYFLDTCVPTVARIKGYVELPDNILSVSKSLAARIGS